MNQPKRNIWIFGGTGFIGRALIKCLSADKANQLHLLVHKNIPYRFLEGYNTFTGSLESFDIRWIEKYPPDIVFHLARIGGSNRFARYLASKTGRKANRRLVSIMASLSHPPVILYVSGSLMYGHQKKNNPANENTELSPVSYARYYVEGERPWLEAQEKGLLDVRFARPGWIVGTTSWFRAFFWEYYLQTGKVPVYGNGRQLMSLVHIEDCAGQLVTLADNAKKGQNMNIFSGSPVTIRTFSEMLASLLNTGVQEVSAQKLRFRYGKTVSEAFESSIPIISRYPETTGLYKNLYPDPESILSNIISQLKHEKGIFPKSP